MPTKSMAHVIVGDRDQVSAALYRARAEGRLVSVTEARVLPGQRVRVLAHLRAPSRSKWERVRPWLVRVGKLAAVLGVVAAVGGLVWLLVLAVLWVIAVVTAVIAWLQAHLVAILLGAAALVFLLACASSEGCGGIHCGGCRG